MPLRIRILLWVFSLFFISMISIFLISHIEISYNLKNEDHSLIKEVKKVDDNNFKNIQEFLSININNDAEKMYHAFKTLKSSSQWLLRFLPNEYNRRTKSWGSSAALLSTFPWLDLISVEINNEVGSYIHQSAPYLRKYVKVIIDENLTLFTTKRDDGCLCAYVGVPFWSNKIIAKYMDDSKFPAFFLTKQPDQWLLYAPEQLLHIDVNSLTQKNNKIYRHLFDEAITLHSQEEINFLVTGLKTMLKVSQNNLKKYPELIQTLLDPHKRHVYMKKKIEESHPDLLHQRNYCVGPLCDFSKQRPEPKWATRRDFAHKLMQKNLIWELCMLTRTGLWQFSPFANDAPKGIVSELIPTLDSDAAFFKNVTEGFFISDVFIDHPLNIPKTCTLKTHNPEYDRKIIFHNKKEGIATSCRNTKLKILYNTEINEPFLTSTTFITYINPPMKTPNHTSITLGVAIDPILTNLALVSSDDVAFISGNDNIRLYTTDGAIVNIENDNDWNRKKLLTQDEGTLTDSNGNKIFFKHIGKITSDDGFIVLIEKQESRTTIIHGINNHIKELAKKVTIHSGILIITALIIVLLILNKIINTITKPIKELVEITTHIHDRNLDKIHIDEKQTQKKDEVGTLYKAFASMIQSMKEGVKVRGLLDKVVSKQVAAKIVKEGIKLGGEKRDLTVMFCNIRNFTSITEKMDPEDVLIMLNECLTLLSGIIDDFEGVIDKYEGDKIMTLFGAPLETKNHPLQATLCALEMQKALSIWNSNREQSGLCKLEVGIGIHSGEAVAGNVGAENHLSYTVLGHIVNLTARLCDYAEGNEILITQETLNNAKDHILYKEKAPKKFKGISEPVITFSVLKKN